MKVKTRKVYYCDFCKKHSLRNIEIHEKHCTNNPNRLCRLCGRKDSFFDLIEQFKKEMSYPLVERGEGVPADKIKQPKLEDLMDSVENCPLCTLTIIRLTGANIFPYQINFDLEEEMRKWWADKNVELPDY